ncbi:hypothetical protein QCA50_006763 [Cerrena zonata]|uniref:Uncharacterized protein n=1 Tax=Cerrena zonata TaxID=2478898 RepID=A0AAW0GM05_9APHY
MQPTTDRGYYNLLGHLSRPSTTLPLETLQASIAHYLAHVQPTPTPFVALVISSPLFQQSLSTSTSTSTSSGTSYTTLQALSTAFRHAIHLKLNHLTSKPSTIFSRSFQSRVDEWVHAVLNGLQGGLPVFRLACASGILLGLEDWEVDLKLKEKEAKVRRKVEEEVVVSLAEVLELYPYLSSASHWRSEFGEKNVEDTLLTTTLLVASTCLPLVAPHRLKALQLRALCGALTATIASAFRSGTFPFLSSLGSLISQSPDDRVSIEATSAFAKTLTQMTGSQIMTSMAALSRTCALTLGILAESRPREGWQVMMEATEAFLAIAKVIEADWIQTPLARITDEDEIAAESRELTAKIWSVLKTLLFTNIMIVQAILTTLAYKPSPLVSHTPYEIALSALQIFAHLSFVLPQFGGVTSTGEGGFPELKKVFYMALDILSTNKEESERFVRGLSESEIRGKTADLPSQVYHAKKAYALACVEQLVPVLSNDCIRDQVYPMCSSHFFDPSHRETYESAHSVMLSIFASHARKTGENIIGLGKESFAEQISPFYARCLAENSGDNQLSPIQLSLAYAALVRCAGTFGRNTENTTHSDLQSRSGDAFAWYCLQTLIDLIRSISSERPSSDYLHRLHLALVATLPSVSLILLPRLLEAIHILAVKNAEPEKKGELVDTMFKEILENIGDQEKEYAMRWWYDHRNALGDEYNLSPARDFVNNVVVRSSNIQEQTGRPVAPDPVSRL